MNAPAQIITALAAVGAAAFLPLSARFQEAGDLQEMVRKREAAKDPALPAGGAAPGTAPPGAEGSAAATLASRAERIPAGVSEAEARQILNELSSLDGKMLSSRQILGLLDKILSLPGSSMEEARGIIVESKNMALGMFLTSALFSRWGELDPEAARTALESMGGNPMFKFPAAASLAAGWMEKDPSTLLKWLNEDKSDGKENRGRDKELRQVAMESLLMGMTPLDASTTDMLISSAPQWRRARMIMDMAERDPDSDPRAAAARAMAEAGEDTNQRRDINNRAGRILADRDPKEALKYAEELDPKERGSVYQATMDSWLRKDKQEAMKWLKEQPPEVQISAVEGMRGEVRDMSYDEIMKFNQGVSAQAASNVMRLAVDENARRNPQEALRYLPGMSDDQRPNGFRTIATEWTQKDAQATSEWIDPLPPGKEKDSAIQGMVWQLREKDPASSTIWASTVGDEKSREDLTNQSLRTWLKRDPEAAKQWINETETLSDAQKANFLKDK